MARTQRLQQKHESYHRQIEVAASAARALHFSSSTPRMKSHPLVAITPAIAKSATPVNASEPNGGQRNVSQPIPPIIDRTPRKRGRNPDLNSNQPRSSVSNPKKMSPMAAPRLLMLMRARDSASSCAGWNAERYDAPPSTISGA